MARTDHSSAIALALSLLLHGSVLYVCSEVVQTSPKPGPQGDGRAPLRPVHSRILIDSPSSLSPAVEAKPVPLPEPPPMADLLPQPEPPLLQPAPPKLIMPLEMAPEFQPTALRSDGFGEMSGSPDATALHSLSGDVPMRAKKAEQDQPYISRDPSGLARPADLPERAQNVGEQKEGLGPMEQRAVDAQAEVRPKEPKPALMKQPAPQNAAEKLDPTRFGPAMSTSQPAEPPVRIALAEPTEQPPTAVMIARPEQAALPAAEAGGSTGSEARSDNNSDPAPHTDSESDPFSVEGSAEFRPGKVVARFGRKVKTVRPRLSLAGQYDLISASPNVVLQVRADETGRVREVKVVQSSGSREIDQPCQLAMYEWWFEPPRDAKGNPRPSEMRWTISFRAR